MTFRLGVILTSLAVLYFLVALALAAAAELRHPLRVTTALAALLVVGLLLLSE